MTKYLKAYTITVFFGWLFLFALALTIDIYCKNVTVIDKKVIVIALIIECFILLIDIGLQTLFYTLYEKTHRYR